MAKLIYSLLFCMMLLALLANPAPVTIELEDVVLILLPCLLGGLSLATAAPYPIHTAERHLIIAIFIYLSYLLISFLIGLVHHVPPLNILRSIGPYLNFFPLLLLSLLPARLINPKIIALILILVGACQACYQFYLYLTHAQQAVSTISVLRSRITLIEPRTTLPIVLAAAILPMAFFVDNTKLLKLLATGIMLFALFAAAATLTRSIILSIFIGWLTFIALYFYQQLQAPFFSLLNLLSNACQYFLVFILLIVLLSLIPKIYMLEQGLLARFYYHTASNAPVDYSNGRLYDEWLPAFNTWLHADYLSLLFGIGAGYTFTVASGEERTYIHNLSIYSLVYGGIYGLFACWWLYFMTAKTLILRSLQAQQTIYLGFAALLVSIFFYGQLFAVHKGLAFNAMLFLMITVALRQPAQIIKE